MAKIVLLPPGEIKRYDLCRAITCLVDEAIAEGTVIELRQRGQNRYIEISGKNVRFFDGWGIFTFSPYGLKKELEDKESPVRRILTLYLKNNPAIVKKIKKGE